MPVRYNQTRTLKVYLHDGAPTLYGFWCPACNDMHHFNVGHPMIPGKVTWQFDGNEESPTFSPSLRYLSDPKCHLFLHAGVIEYCGDSPKMAGQKVPLPVIPDHSM